MCGPHRGRFKAVNLSASGSYVFVIGRRGDMFTRFYDFDISGHDPVFFDYSYEDQRGKGDGAPIQLPAARWVEQPKIPGRITVGDLDPQDGRRRRPPHPARRGQAQGETGYWERDVADPRADGWKFHASGLPLTRKRLRNPRRDTSRRGLGRSEDRRYGDLRRFNVYCSPARIRRDGRHADPAPRRRPAPAGARSRARRRAADAVRRGRGGREVHGGHGSGDP